MEHKLQVVQDVQVHQLQVVAEVLVRVVVQMEVAELL
jgi:hypothetical protein